MKPSYVSKVIVVSAVAVSTVFGAAGTASAAGGHRASTAVNPKAKHHNPCTKGQKDVYYSNPSNGFQAGKVHASGHGAVLTYHLILPTPTPGATSFSTEKLTWQAKSGHHVKAVYVSLTNFKSGRHLPKAKVKAKNTGEYHHHDTKTDVQFFDVCVK
jgi:hypothetical protein